jgi:hypothetical protein
VKKIVIEINNVRIIKSSSDSYLNLLVILI